MINFKSCRALIILILLPFAIYAQETGSMPALMPMPQSIEMAAGIHTLDSAFTVQIEGNPAQRLYGAASRMLHRLSRRTGLFFSQGYITPETKIENASMIIKVDHPGHVKLYEDESYSLLINQDRILLSANTDIGALRGIQTFLQLLEAGKDGYFFPDVVIKDFPRFPWRGLMIDAARHFMPVNVIKRNLDGMAAVKLNVFHWHLSDDQGFRVECKTFPKLTGRGSDGNFYTQAQVKDIINYANERGIRVVPEFDLPGHATSWLVGYPQYASLPGPYKIERKWGVFNPTFDPTNPATYAFLDKFFKEMSKLFPDEYMHIGGDENNGIQWDENPEIQKFMKTHNIKNNEALQSYFNQHLLKILTKYHKKMIGWDEILRPDMPKNIVIQSWRGIKSLKDAVTRGYRVVLSNGYYIDLNQPASYHYSVDPDPDSLNLTASQKKLVLGGEATMWSEYVSPENIDSRIWPRMAAIAERFWSSKNVRDVKYMYKRLDVISCELENVGLMHIKNPQMMIRRLSGCNEVEPLSVFISVVEPVKNYNRLKQRGDYTQFSPLTRVVDAAVPDAETARNFRNLVSEYLEGGCRDTAEEKSIKKSLILWENNDYRLEKIIDKSPILEEIKPMSINLSEISLTGLKALDYIVNNIKADTGWVNYGLSELRKAKEPYGQVELMIVSPIEKLIEYAGKINLKIIK